LEQFDGKSVDLGPNRPARLIAAEQKQRATFVDGGKAARDPLVRQDLDILTHWIDQTIEGTQLSEQFLLDWTDVPQFVFGNMNRALDPQFAAARQAKAKELLERYTGLFPGTTPLVDLARARWAESQGPGKVGPYKGEVE